MKKRGLGKGLDALLSPITAVSGSHFDAEEQLLILPVDMIVRGKYQPRMGIDADALAELADSIRAQGVMQPIVVRPLTDTDNYEIIAGERRWRATQLAGLHEIPALVKPVSDQAVMCLALIENIQREDLNPMDQARAIARLQQEFAMTHDDIAKALGKSRPSVSNLLRLLELHADVIKFLERGQLEMGHGKVILSLKASKQQAAANTVVTKSLSVRATEKLVKQMQHEDKKGKDDKVSTNKTDANINKLQQEISQRLGAAVVIKHTKKSGKGTLQIRYSSLEALGGILNRIK